MIQRALASVGLVLVLCASALSQTGLQADLVGQLKDAEVKFVALAEKMTQEQYAWRPMEGVRSVGEVFVHIAVANVVFLQMVGVESSMKVDWGMEKKVTDKAKIVEMLKESFRLAKEAVAKISDQDLDKTVKIFGRDGTCRSALVLTATHAHEHLGQSIAYARVNKVVPPWSQRDGM
jgi:uncharacterized damage-inducible protein DinB